jgi:hypothetical protein
MGFGNVRHALTLSRAELRAAGIANPTPQQIEAAMMGGTVTTADGRTVQLKGVLQLRSQGMGWGQIRHTLSLPPTTLAMSPHAGSGITSALGPAHSAAAQARRSDAEVEAHEAAGGRAVAIPLAHPGVVTAAGAPAGAPLGAWHGGGQGRGAR